MDGSTEALVDWGPFGKPLFDDPSTRDLARVGVIDVGSNSVRFVVFDGAARSPAYFFNEKVMCALGAGVPETGRLNPEGRERALKAIARFCSVAANLDIPYLTAVATAAVRDAEDGANFVAEVKAETGLNIRIVEGEEEARLSAQGVLLGWPGAYGLICDIGGSSMELAEIASGHVGKRISLPLGPLKLQSTDGGKAGRAKLISDTLTAAFDDLGPQTDRLFLVGGSWRAIARIDMERKNYPLQVIHEYRMTVKDLQATAQFVEDHDLEDLRNICSLSSARMALVPIALEVLAGLIERFHPHDIALSSYGIREGMLYEQMPQNLRDRDPLIEACRFAEAKDARLPGFGKRLAAFVNPLFARANYDETRLILATCLLHDVSWRAHPDYRAEICFDSATRANLGGLRHSERVFIAMALMYRYRNKPQNDHIEPTLGLLREGQLQKAEVLGKAIRLGAMLWVQDDAKAARFEYSAENQTLELLLKPSAYSLFGEVALARLQSLGKALEAKVDVQYV